MNKVRLEVVKLSEDAIIPSYAHEGDSGFDLHSTVEVVIPPYQWRTIPTGLAMNLPPGYEVQVRSRSGNAHKRGLFVLNSPGTVDSGYRGEWMIILANHSPDEHFIHKGDRIAQGVLSPVVTAELVNTAELQEDTNRGSGGFGSTGN